MFNTLHVGSLFKVYECAVGAVLHRFLGADATGFELVGFCFSQTQCFSLQYLSQTINTVSALDKPAFYTL